MGRHRGPKNPPPAKKPPLTHFLCLPLVTPTSRLQLEVSVKEFRRTVCPSDPGNESTSERPPGGQSSATGAVLPNVHPKAIRPVGALHCTLGVMSLNSRELEVAVQLLKSLDVHTLLKEASHKPSPDATTPSQTNQIENNPHSGKLSSSSSSVSQQTQPPLTIDLKGLVSMHTPQSTSILYIAPQEPTERLLPFCLAVQKLFRERNLSVADDRPLKLHATVVNTIYAKGRKRPSKPPIGPASTRTGPGEDQDDRSQGHGPNANAPLKFDATGLLERLSDFVWAESVVLDRVAICEMGAKKIFDGEGRMVGEEYTEIASVKLPT